MERLFAPNKKDAERIGKVVRRVERLPEDITKSARQAPTSSEDVYLVKIIGSTADPALHLGVEVLYDDGSALYVELEQGIKWKVLTDEDPLNAGPIRSSQDIVTAIPIGSVYEAILTYNTDGEATWIFIVPNTEITPVFTAGSNVGDGKTVPIQFSFDIFNGFVYTEPTVCSARGAGDCGQFIEKTDRVYTVLEDAAGAGDHVRMYAEIQDLPITAAIDAKQSIEVDAADDELHFVNDENFPASCGYYGVDNTGTRSWEIFEELFQIITPPGSINITNTSCVFDWQLDGDELNPADCTFYGKRLGARGWQAFADMVQKSITLDAGTCKLELVNDDLAPGDKFYYGTSGGVKGFHELDDAGSVLVKDSITGDGLLGTELRFVNDETAVPAFSIYGTSSGVGPVGLSWRGLDVFAKDSIEFNTSGFGGYHLINDTAAATDGELYCAFSEAVPADHRGWFDISDFLKDVANYSGTTKQLIFHSLGDASAEWSDMSVLIQNSIVLDGTTDQIELDGDESAPGNDKYYGTDDGGIKGYHDLVTSVLTTNSVTGDGLSGTEIELVNDEASPGSREYYGTDPSSVKGYHAFVLKTFVTDVIANCDGSLQVTKCTAWVVDPTDLGPATVPCVTSVEYEVCP